uniref:Uncharacterized protein n=1 Tax=Parascaris equorum TaxID=6256 RepID=A0A914S6X6_PAREQ
MIRRWKPSTLEVTSVSEVSLSPIHKDQIAALKRQISAHYHVPFEEIELTEVSDFHVCFISFRGATVLRKLVAS